MRVEKACWPVNMLFIGPLASQSACAIFVFHIIYYLLETVSFVDPRPPFCYLVSVKISIIHRLLEWTLKRKLNIKWNGTLRLTRTSTTRTLLLTDRSIIFSFRTGCSLPRHAVNMTICRPARDARLTSRRTAGTWYAFNQMESRKIELWH